ncbi:hypothetical protein [Peribacillus simplex]|nr:hypothetical protein [Peribacillus simplex]MDR4924753.1 hypothetical protein [Peribacillus simplex]WHX90511.1 hypothetical protein QNH50_21255 [Peribacillus simplex]
MHESRYSGTDSQAISCFENFFREISAGLKTIDITLHRIENALKGI